MEGLVFSRKALMHPQEFLTFVHYADEAAAPTRPPPNTT